MLTWSFGPETGTLVKVVGYWWKLVRVYEKVWILWKSSLQGIEGILTKILAIEVGGLHRVTIGNWKLNNRKSDSCYILKINQRHHCATTIILTNFQVVTRIAFWVMRDESWMVSIITTSACRLSAILIHYWPARAERGNNTFHRQAQNSMYSRASSFETKKNSSLFACERTRGCCRREINVLTFRWTQRPN